MPHFTGENGVCHQLKAVIGECDGKSRWKPLLDSGCRTGTELSNSWRTLKGNAQKCASYLGQDIQGPFEVEVENVREDSSNGSRKMLVMKREELRGAVMKVALFRLTNPNQRDSIAWLN